MNDDELSGRWNSIRSFLSRKTAFGMETGALKFVDEMAFEPDPELFEMVAGAKVFHSVGVCSIYIVL
jgi:hypothetical protein